MKYKTIKYSDQYLAKTLFKKTLLFILFLVTICFGFWYLNIFQSLMQGQYSWWYLSPIVLSIAPMSINGTSFSKHSISSPLKDPHKLFEVSFPTCDLIK